ncbi:Bax inhibitor-1/YccA family protein [Candidatus Finniella inopinata]|uniref:Bax inhibitor-1/YccA family protein n=2 Tax=Candidatus Finniella inopinata TaxID=1696036 RepID=A0A4V2DZZ9_9PROT|nr:Bax inhibitor-1/YccA family protein [Candidatus Finniella inopinata]
MSNRFDDQPIIRNSSAAQAWDVDAGLRSYMIKVYSYMAMGLGLTGLVAFVTASSPAFFQAIFGTPLMWVVMLAPLGIVFFLSARIGTLSLSAAQTTFWVYAGVMGLSLSSIFYVYTGQSIARLFFVSASVFGAMSLYGYTTKKDLTNVGSFLFMGLIGLVIASMVNLFLQSTALQLALSYVGVLVFTGLTAYDTQVIKELYFEADSTEVAGKKAIIGALNLYMDFINLFLALLRIFGDRR